MVALRRGVVLRGRQPEQVHGFLEVAMDETAVQRSEHAVGDQVQVTRPATRARGLLRRALQHLGPEHQKQSQKTVRLQRPIFAQLGTLFASPGVYLWHTWPWGCRLSDEPDRVCQQTMLT